MAQFDDTRPEKDRPDDLREVADALRRARPTLSPLQSDELKRRVLASRRGRGTVVGWRGRLVLTSVLVLSLSATAFGVAGGIKPKDLLTTASSSNKQNAPNTVYRGGAPRMTGGGHAPTIIPAGDEVHHGFELRCNTADHPQRLQINWGQGNSFHLTTLTSSTCVDDPSVEPDPPSAGFDTYIGSGTGRLKGGETGTAEWCFLDAGEPGTADRIQVIVRDSSGTIILLFVDEFNQGNHQAHGQFPTSAPSGSCPALPQPITTATTSSTTTKGNKKK
jgi:hypothetical protein